MSFKSKNDLRCPLLSDIHFVYFYALIILCNKLYFACLRYNGMLCDIADTHARRP